MKPESCNVEHNEHKEPAPMEGISENGEAFTKATHLKTLVAQSNHAECNKVEEPAPKQPIIQNAGTPINTPELKKMDTDTKIAESTDNRDITEKVGLEKSSSLSYMLLAANLASVLDTTDRDIISR